MATITRRPFVSHLRATATSHIVYLKKGKTRRSGAGLAFWFRPLSASLSEVPVEDRDMSLFFHTRTADFQDAAVQATVSYRIGSPDLAAARVDFSIDPKAGTWLADPLASLNQLISDSAQQHANATLATLPLADAISTGIVATRDAIATGLAQDERITSTGLAIIGVRVLSIRAETEVERALQTPTREAVQREADRATYERRAAAVEHERTIAQNELQSRIELATRTKELLQQEGENARKSAEDAAAARAIADDAQARAEVVIGEARAKAAKAAIDAHKGADPQLLLARAAQAAAGNLGNVQQLTITPDLLGKLLGSDTTK